MNLKQTPCPKCNRKGLHYANHPHAQGWKDYSKAECRFCGERFKLTFATDKRQAEAPPVSEGKQQS